MRRLLFYLVILALLCSCAALQPQREVVDNEFHSSHPKVTVKVASGFKYLGQVSYHKAGKDYQGMTTVGYDYNPCIFISTDYSDFAKTLIVDIRKTEYYFVTDLLSVAENKLEYGTCKLARKNYQYYTKLIEPRPDNPVYKLVMREGYVVPNCLLMRSYKRVVGSKGNTMINIRYYEELPDSFPGCAQWKNRESLSENQVECLNEFCKNCDAAFEVLE